jgi:hypothetical protein
MDKQEIENWLTTGKQHVIQTLGLPVNWWPTTAANQQARASAWATAFFTQGALANAAGATLTARCTIGAQNLSLQILNAYWVNGVDRLHDATQLMLDYCVTNEGASSPIQVTGESEVGPSYPIEADPIPENGYAWDFYKLLIVPSATRLFLARVAAHDGVGAPQRIAHLAANLRTLVDFVGFSHLRSNDELGAVLIPATSGQRNETMILWVVRGRVRIERVTPGVL